MLFGSTVSDDYLQPHVGAGEAKGGLYAGELGLAARRLWPAQRIDRAEQDLVAGRCEVLRACRGYQQREERKREATHHVIRLKKATPPH